MNLAGLGRTIGTHDPGISRAGVEQHVQIATRRRTELHGGEICVVVAVLTDSHGIGSVGVGGICDGKSIVSLDLAEH